MGLKHWLADRFGGVRRFGGGGTLLPHEPPPIFHHWLRTHVHPLLHGVGLQDLDAFLIHWLRDGALRSGADAPRFVSIGSRDARTELRLAAALAAAGIERFTIECVESDPLLQSGARAAALSRGLDRHLLPVRADGNTWRARGRYDGVLADGSLEGTARLERLLDEVHRSLADGAWFVVRARIGRNGHLRWPEALLEVQGSFRELPASHRWNHVARRHEEVFQDRNGARLGADGIRAQDVLPELLRRFSVPVFIGFGNIVDAFVGPAFGPNFSPHVTWDRRFIAGVQARDEELLQAGRLTPTRMVAVLSRDDEPARFHARALSPEQCVRRPDG